MNIFGNMALALPRQVGAVYGSDCARGGVVQRLAQRIYLAGLEPGVCMRIQRIRVAVCIGKGLRTVGAGAAGVLPIVKKRYAEGIKSHRQALGLRREHHTSLHTLLFGRLRIPDAGAQGT